MSQRVDNSVAWVLSEEDEVLRSANAASAKLVLDELRGDVSFHFSGERDQVSRVMADILACSNRVFPIRLQDTAGERRPYEVRFDFIEGKATAAAMGRYLSHLQPGKLVTPLVIPKDDERKAPPSVSSCGDTFWILIPCRFVRHLQAFLNELFDYELFGQVLQLSRLSQTQLLLFQSACLRIALETALHHELGHILHGHQSAVFEKMMEDSSFPSDANCRDWTSACEMAADDAAAQTLTAATLQRRFITFPVESELDQVGPFALINALFLGVSTYYILQQIGRLEELKADGVTMTPFQNTDRFGTPPCGERPPCQTVGRRSKRGCTAAGYPTVAARMRYFYMTFNDVCKEVSAFGENEASLFLQLSTVLKALGKFLDHKFAEDDTLIQLHRVFDWLTLYGSQDVVLQEINGVITLSRNDQRALQAVSDHADRAEQEVLAEIEPMYALFQKYQPFWSKLKILKEADNVRA